jgi:hypothetical protein
MRLRLLSGVEEDNSSLRDPPLISFETPMCKLFDDVASLAIPCQYSNFMPGLEDMRLTFRVPREPHRQSLPFTNHGTF